MTGYRVPARAAEAEIEVSRSRFLCRIERVESEDAARAVVEQARARHGDARHHCSAFMLGPEGRIARSSDDGEPSGTAGAPMLEVLRGAEVNDVVAVVTRWFGGTLLGAGGLVRAYLDAVRAGLGAAGVRERRLLDLWETRVALAVAPRLENELRARGVVVRDVAYGGDAVTFTLAVPAGEELSAVLAALTGGSIDARMLGSDWVDL